MMRGWLTPHIETIWAAKLARPHPVHQTLSFTRERWITPDQDFIDVDFLVPPSRNDLTPMWVLFHGLEGSSQSHYAQAFARYAQTRQLQFCVPHFRGCSGEINHAPRAYHSGDWQEIDWILRRLSNTHKGQIYAIGVSLGGNALMRWAGEIGSAAASIIQAAVAICSPLDLMACGFHLGRGLNRYLYTPMFLKTLKPRALQKLAQYPKLFNQEKMLASRTLFEFDNWVTAPLHGFKNTNDYWTKASAKPHLKNIKVPAFLINALNDPFIPADSLPQLKDVSSHVRLWHPKRGGHVGFTANYLRGFPGDLQTLPATVGRFFI